jgi:uncharacterized protein with von Willebrand factor type A (vWA) domain
MNQPASELRELLGDGAAAAGVVATHTSVVEESPTVLRVDRWTRRTAERVAGQWGELGLFETPEGEATPEGTDRLAADAIETLLSSAPKFAERPAEPGRAQWWKQLMESPECGALRSRTVLSPAVAEIAAGEIAKQWVAYAAAHGDAPHGEDETPEQFTARVRSTRKAMADACQAADDAEAVSAGLGLGGGTTLEAAKLAQYTRRLRMSGNLANIMRMAGRFIAKARQLQRQRTDLPGLEITGVELSGDLSRLLPVESSLVAGAVPELEMLALSRVAQRRALSYRRISREPVAMGPIVVSVDESGSMEGEKIEAAKGLALAMASIARAQKRPFLLSAFSGDATIRTASGSPDAIVEWMEQFFNGGTVLDGPLHTLPTTAWPAGKIGARSDHIIITDDEVPLADELLASYTTWARKQGVRTFGIGIGLQDVETLARVCDGGCWCLPNLDLNNPAVDAILSIGPTHREVRAA